MRKNRLITILTAAAVAVSMFASCTSDAGASDSIPKTESAAETAAEPASAEQSQNSGGYIFDDTTESITVDGVSYVVLSNRSVKMDHQEVSYEEILSYKSPYADYVGDIYTDDSLPCTLADTAAAAIIYAYENDIETIDIPVEFDTSTLDAAWEFISLAYPNVPVSGISSYYERSDKGLYRMRLSESVRKCAGSEEPLRIAREMVDSIPEDCVTDAQKAFYLYDKLCSEVVYDSYHADNNIGMVNAAPQSAYGALVDKRAVCDGIAGGLQLLFELAGIDCSKLASDGTLEEDGHVWNTAVIDGEVWDFDATWDIWRFYDDEGDKITEEINYYGGYAWFGYSRCEKGVDVILNGYSSFCAPPTYDYYTDKSPALLIYDYCGSSSGTIYTPEGPLGEDKSFLDSITERVGSGETVRVSFDNRDDMIRFTGALERRDRVFDDLDNEELIYLADTQMGLMILKAPE